MRSFCAMVLVCMMALGTGASAATSGDGAVSGQVHSATGAPIVNATLKLVADVGGQPPQTMKSGPGGAFTFSGLAAGSYYVEVTQSGFAPTTSEKFNVTSGPPVVVDVSLVALNTTSMTEIGRVVVNGKSQLNSSGLSSITITPEDIASHGITNIADALDQLPGVTIQRENGEAGAPAVIDIRGTTGSGTNYGNFHSAETLVLQDGEPVRAGVSGNADLDAFFPSLYQRIEIVKGVGGSTIYGADAIGGTVNFVTRNPSPTHETDVLAGIGTESQYLYSILDTNTIGHLGYVVALGRSGTTGIFPPNTNVDIGGSGFAWFFGGAPTTYTPQTAVGLIGPVSDSVAKSALYGKLRYDFSPVTYATVSYSDYNDFRNNAFSPTTLTPLTIGGTTYANDPLGNPYVEALPGTIITDALPKLTFDLTTQVLGGTLIARAYNQYVKLSFDTRGAIDTAQRFIELNNDHLGGEQLQYTRPLDSAGRQTLTAGYGVDFDNFNSLFGTTLQQTFSGGQNSQLQRTAFLRDDVILGPKLSANLALFASHYDTLNVRRLDPHFAMAYKPSADSVVHFSVGSGFIPQRLSDLIGITQSDLTFPIISNLCPPTETACEVSGGNRALLPETALGYDLGYDRNWSNGAHFGIDLYHTLMFNDFFSTEFAIPPGIVFTNGAPALFESGPTNVGRAIFQGIELSAEQPLGGHVSLSGYYTTQASYPIDVNLVTLQDSFALNNNEQFEGIPLHKIGGSLNLNVPHGVSAYFGFTYFDTNNVYGQTPFSLFNAGVTIPLGKNLIHLTAVNIFNKDATLFDNLNGTPYVGFNGPILQTATSTAPRSFLLSVERKFGGR
jgi:outer membrane receptor for ferrienterochelin and colicin